MQLAVHMLSVAFTAPDGGVVAALGPLSLDVESSSFVCVLGPSGSGKSTLIRVLAGLQAPSSGTAHAGDTRIAEPLPQISLMFQEANLMPWRTVRDNIALPLELAGIAQKERYKRVASILPRLGLGEFAQAYPAELSGGMAQRVALGRVLIQQPDVLLLDEPFGALDALTRERISFDLLDVWAEQKQTVVMVTHDINEAVLLSDRVIVLSQRPGRLIADIDVPLARPRTLEMSYTPEFVTLAREIRQAIDRA